MRPETMSAAHVVLDLLQRADALATAATAAIESGDDAHLGAVLEERGAVIDAILRTWREAAHRPTPEQLARVTQATRTSLALGVAVRNTAIVTRDQVAAALAALDARQLASHEYQPGSPQGTIDLVL